MLESSLTKLLQPARDRVRDSRAAISSDASDEMRRHFRDNYPILLDGALFAPGDPGLFFRQARETLARGGSGAGMLPAAILREALDAVGAAPRPALKAGAVAVSPRSARIWWDGGLLEDDGDILASLDKPRPVLRFYDITGIEPAGERWNGSFDVDVTLGELGKTVDFWAADRAYLVDLGVVHADGRFLRLARANRFDLPRECRGDTADFGLARSNLRPRQPGADPLMVPDSLAREWIEARPDHAGRDVEAELFIHMAYRAFLREGPRALKRSPKPIRRDQEVLAKEFAQRGRQRRRRAVETRPGGPGAPALLVARLDTNLPAAPAGLLYPPLAVGAPAAWRRVGLASGRFALYRGVVDQARLGAVPPLPRAKAPEPAAFRPDALVQPWSASAGVERSRPSSPVFEAAQMLRERWADVDAAGKETGRKKKSGDRQEFGGAEAKRFAKAGVRFTRLTLTLEGKMRPGARLKVGGKLVYADAEGNFRLDCVVAGGKTRIPLRAGCSVGGEARGLINIDWERREERREKK